MLPLLAKILFAYLLGSISGSLLLGRFRGVDIRTLGSGNAGGTNALRTQGWRFALAVVLIDVGKGAVAAALGLWSVGQSSWPAPIDALLCIGAAAAGHVWPVFYGFRGGKGAAVVIGGYAVVQPLVLIPTIGVWLLSLFASGYVGLSTVLAGICVPIAVGLIAPAHTRGSEFIAGFIVALFLAFTHRGNLQRLRGGTENRFEKARWLGRLLERHRSAGQDRPGMQSPRKDLP